MGALGGRRAMPAAGSGLAVALAVAAGLTAKCARKAVGRIEDAEALLERAGRIEGRALELADEDVVSFEAVLHASRDGDPDMALAAAAGPPYEIAECAVEVASIAAELALRGTPWLRGDAHAAAVLAEAAACSAVALVHLNVAGSSAGDGRWGRARQLTEAAAESRSRAEAILSRAIG